jgi:hypothetical protein
MLVMDETWRAVHEALAKVRAELDGIWPVPYPKRREHPLTRANRMRGYARERGRRPIEEQA